MKIKEKLVRLSVLAMCAILAVTLTACGGSANSSTPDAPATSSAAENASANAGTNTPAASGEAVEVVFWHSTSGATGEALESIIKAYNDGPGKEKNISVALVYQGYEGTDKVMLAYQTKDTANAPDINIGLTSTIPMVMDMGWSVSAERFLNSPDSEVSKDTFFEQMQRTCTYQGEMVAVPFANSIPLLYYNIEALKEAGYTEPPKTMDQLAEYVEKLTVKDGGNISRYGLNMQTKRYQLVEFCVSQRPDALFGNNEGGRSAPMTKITAGEDGTLRAYLEKLQMLLDTGGYKYVEDSINEEFAQGLSAMVIQSSSRMGTLDGLMPGQYMTAFLPKVNDSDTNGAAVGGSCLNMFDRGDEARLNAAWDVVQWCVSPESQYTFSTASGYIPVNVGCEDLPEMKDYYEKNPQYKVALDQMKAANPLSQEPLDLTYNEINGIITEAMLEFCQGVLDIDGTIAKITDKCNASLDEYHAANS